MEDALQQSQRVGDLLLKCEQQETAEISRLAADLIDREYRQAISGANFLSDFQGQAVRTLMQDQSESWCLTSCDGMQGTFEGPSLSQREGSMHSVLQGKC